MSKKRNQDISYCYVAHADAASILVALALVENQLRNQRAPAVMTKLYRDAHIHFAKALGLNPDNTLPPTKIARRKKRQ